VHHVNLHQSAPARRESLIRAPFPSTIISNAAYNTAHRDLVIMAVTSPF
jgi:hypothetical protein